MTGFECGYCGETDLVIESVPDAVAPLAPEGSGRSWPVHWKITCAAGHVLVPISGMRIEIVLPSLKDTD